MAAQANLVSWLEQHGGYVHPKLDLFSPLDNGDRGVRAKAAIPEGDQLLLVPKALCLYLHDESVSSKVSINDHCTHCPVPFTKPACRVNDASKR